MEKKIQVMIVEDQHIFRKGLSLLLKENPQVIVCGEATNGQQFLDTFEPLRPDIVFMDIRMPVMNGIDATREALQRCPDLKVIAISMFGEEEYLVSMIEAGVKGFLLKTAEEYELQKALKLVMQNRNYFSDELIPTLTASLMRSKNQDDTKDRFHQETLTTRELEVLQHICSGFTIKEIADKLHISQRTVDGHKANLFKKAGVDSSVKLVTFAIKNKLFKI